MAFRRRQTARTTRQPGRTTWARLVPAAWSTVAAGAKVQIIAITLDNPGISETVRRTRGRFNFASDQAAAMEEISGAWGMIVVTDAAAAIGVTAIPGPVTDSADGGWFVWEPFGAVLGNAAAAAGNAASTLAPIMYDSKAMRKIQDGFQVAVVVENASASTGLVFGMGLAMLTSRV